MSETFDAETGEVIDTPSRSVVRHQHQPADVDVLAIVERRNKLMERLLHTAISATTPEQWVDQSGKPYPTSAAAEVMARRCAVSITNTTQVKQVRHDDKGESYLYIVKGTARLPGGYDEIEAIGTCDSRDQFLGTETRSGRALSEVDEGNILKAAYSNFLVNAITRLLGVRNMTWDKLQSMGIDPSKASKVEYKAGSKGGGAGSSDIADEQMKWGDAKGQTLRQMSSKNRLFYRDAATRDLDDPEKKQFKKRNEKIIAAVDALEQRPADTATEAAPKQSPWQRIQAEAKAAGLDDATLKTLVKDVTKKASTGQLEDGDVQKMREAIAAREDVAF